MPVSDNSLNTALNHYCKGQSHVYFFCLFGDKPKGTEQKENKANK